jgi:Peptidase family S41/Tricorn protease C1 domain
VARVRAVRGLRRGDSGRGSRRSSTHETLRTDRGSSRVMPASLPLTWRTLLAVVLLSAACGGEAVGRTTEPVTESYESSFDRMWMTVDREYSYMEYKGIDWTAVRRAQRPRASQARGTAELVEVVRAALGTLQDVHVWIVTPGGGIEPTYRPSHRMNWGPAMLARQRQGTGWVSASEVVGGRRIDGVPYLALTSFVTGKFSVADFDRMLARHREDSVLVLDVRMNGGGSDVLAYDVAGRFTVDAHTGGYYQFRNGWRYDAFTPRTARRVVPRGSWQFTRPVVLLTGRGSYSATEGFVSAMRTLPNVVVVGDTTGGGLGQSVGLSAARGLRLRALPLDRVHGGRATDRGTGDRPRPSGAVRGRRRRGRGG